MWTKRPAKTTRDGQKIDLGQAGLLNSAYDNRSKYRKAPGMRKFKLSGMALLSLAWLMLGGCATTAPSLRDIPPLQGQPVYPAPDLDPLETSPAMREFVAAWKRDLQPGDNPAWSLAYTATSPYLLNFTYDPMVTLTAREAFERKTGNCLTFSNLFIALAREAGLEAWYREVEALPEWSNFNDTALVSMHTNAEVRDGLQQYVVDVSRRRQAAREEVRRLSDVEATAQFYNNLGAEALVEQDLARAHAWFRKALETSPRLAYVWSNLGVVYRRNGQQQDATMAYERALAIDPDHSVSLNNLYLMYEERGEHDKAAEMAARVERMRRSNPYYLLHLAQAANEEAAYQEAAELLKRAIRIRRSEYRFHRELAYTRYLQGDMAAAQASLETARRLAPEGMDIQWITLPDGARPGSE